MIRSQPLLMLVATIMLLLAGLAGLWLSILPRHVLSQAATRLADDQGMTLEAERPRLRFHNGFSLELESVSLASRDSEALSATARNARFDIGWAALFGRSPKLSAIELDGAVITADVNAAASWAAVVQRFTLRDASLRLRDETLKAVFSLSDLNGTWQVQNDGAAKLQTTFLLNGGLARFVADIESADRLLRDGSPSDLTFAAKQQSATFSGRLSLAKGLQFDGQTTLEATSLAELAGTAGVAVTSLQLPVSLVSGLSITGLSADFKTLQGKVGASTISGQLLLQPGVDRVNMSGALQVDTLQVPGADLRQPWRETPLALWDLLGFDSDVTLQVQAFRLQEQAMGNAAISLKGKDGVVALTFDSASFGGGAVQASFKLARSNVEASVTAENVEADAALPALLGIDWLSGKTSFTLTSKSSGDSAAALISTTTGNIEITSPALTLKGRNLGNAVKTPTGDWSPVAGENTSGLALKLRGTLSDGIVTLSDTTLDGSGLALKTTGEVDLLRQNLALELSGKGVAPGLSLQGPWTHPGLLVGTPPELRQGKDTGKPAKAEAPPAN